MAIGSAERRETFSASGRHCDPINFDHKRLCYRVCCLFLRQHPESQQLGDWLAASHDAHRAAAGVFEVGLEWDPEDVIHRGEKVERCDHSFSNGATPFFAGAHDLATLDTSPRKKYRKTV